MANGTLSFEEQQVEDKSSPTSPRFERPLGRSGAPRWGAIGPRTTKVRRVNKLTLDEAEPKEKHGERARPRYGNQTYNIASLVFEV